MKHIQLALQPIIGGVIEIQGTSDLTLAGVKFCGNAQRRKRGYVLFHGVFLLHMDLGAIETHLPVPAKQPSYRQNRPHKDFLTNLEVSPVTVKRVLRRMWQAQETAPSPPPTGVERLVKNQYATQEWICKF
jgi:lipoate-protein ligase A